MASRWYNPRRLLVTVVGGAVLLAGIVMLVTPGPALVVIPLGLAILASEYVWAANVLRKVREKARQTADRLRGRRDRPGNSRGEGDGSAEDDRTRSG